MRGVLAVRLLQLTLDAAAAANAAAGRSMRRCALRRACGERASSPAPPPDATCHGGVPLAGSVKVSFRRIEKLKWIVMLNRPRSMLMLTETSTDAITETVIET